MFMYQVNKSLIIGVVGIKMQKLWNLFILPGEVVK
jgi:hypothetical protein